MKHLIAILFLLFSITQCYAQELRLEKDVTLLEKNIHAQRNTRNDEKGNPCGLILVRSTEPDLTFTGNVIGDIDYNNATYYVYMSPGSTKLTVSNGRRNMLNLKFSPLQQKTTYEAIVLETSDKGSLSLRTVPSGAEVFLVNKGERISLGRTPIKSTVEIKTGTYRIEVEKKGYEGWRKRAVTITKGKTTDLGKIKLKAL